MPGWANASVVQRDGIKDLALRSGTAPTFNLREVYMKRVFIRLSVCCALGLLVSQACAEERVLAGGQQRDCSQMSDAKQKARCENTNKAMQACAGKKNGGELTNCLMEQHTAQRKHQ